VTLKWASSLDGRIATVAGESRWITGEAARRAALELREEHDAILVGSGTALADDPRLTRRLGRAPGPILRVVVDRRLRLPPRARLFDEPGPVVVYTAAAERTRAVELAARGAEVVELGRVDPAAVLADLATRDVQSLLVEGGGTIAATFFETGLWERATAFVAPRLIGGAAAPTPLAGAGLGGLAASVPLERVRTRRRGVDLEISGVRAGCLRALSSSVGV
jgi:diaminohydroxyphosphoribosylaminopyrimidine deaminase/5-amino-6-(5-phosphoribosylamino)uracil reductase